MTEALPQPWGIYRTYECRACDWSGEAEKHDAPSLCPACGSSYVFWTLQSDDPDDDITTLAMPGYV